MDIGETECEGVECIEQAEYRAQLAVSCEHGVSKKRGISWFAGQLPNFNKDTAP
jgi:hypothetical protein